MSAIVETPIATAASRTARFEVSFAQNAAEVRETQRLRHRVFAGELGATVKGGDEGVDRDEYDAFCRHLMVRDTLSGDVIACTRILTDDQAPRAGGFYSASEFDLAMIDSLPGRLMEIGRTCVDADYRGGAAIATLWQGIAGYITSHGFDYLFGCASIGLEDGGASAHAILAQIRGKYLAPDFQRVRPYIPLPAADHRPTDKARLPPLLKAYVSLGAKACGEPYWDRDFNCADVFMLLDVSELNPRYARHFLGRDLPSPTVRLAA
jgi:putative hemolysin